LKFILITKLFLFLFSFFSHEDVNFIFLKDIIVVIHKHWLLRLLKKLYLIWSATHLNNRSHQLRDDNWIMNRIYLILFWSVWLQRIVWARIVNYVWGSWFTDKPTSDYSWLSKYSINHLESNSWVECYVIYRSFEILTVISSDHLRF
jgi:hypothetical protein